MNNEKFVNNMKEEAAREMLINLMNALDGLDEEDILGTEGWKHYLGFDD